MNTTKTPSLLLLKFFGPDSPGITAEVTKVMSSFAVTIEDLEQIVLQGQLILCFVVQEPKEQIKFKAGLRKSAASLGLSLTMSAVKTKSLKLSSNQFIATLIGDPIDTKSIHLMADILKNRSANIQSIRQLSSNNLKCLQLQVYAQNNEPALLSLKKELLEVLGKNRVDIALQQGSLSQKNKRLVAMDMDSTLIQEEVINEIAKANGAYDQVAKITQLAMQGEIDFKESICQRVSLLQGLPLTQVKDIAKGLRLNPGVERFIRALKGMGMKLALITGGFGIAAHEMGRALGFDYVFANELGHSSGKLTGSLVGRLIDAEEKARILKEIAQNEKMREQNIVAIGDGANDAHMLASAGLGIAYCAKEKLRQKADFALNHRGMDAILYLLGLSEREVEDLIV